MLDTAKNLRDALVEGAGFQKLEAADLVIEDTAPPPSLFDTRRVTLTTPPRMTALPPTLSRRVSFEPATGHIVVSGELTEAEAESIAEIAATPDDRKTVRRALAPAAAAAPAPAPAGVDRSPLRIPRACRSGRRTAGRSSTKRN